MVVNQKDIQSIANWLGAGSINLFGMPFAGKDTQGKKLANIFNAILVGGGDILRSGQAPERVLKTINAGRLAPIEEFISIVLPYLSKPEFKGKPLILSSIGRWHGEETHVLAAAKAANHPMRVVVYIKVNDEVAERRWRSGHAQKDRGIRVDDTGKSLAIRLEEFRNKTEPVIDFYRKKGMLVEIDGSKSPDEVTNEILNVLARYATSH